MKRFLILATSILVLVAIIASCCFIMHSVRVNKHRSATIMERAIEAKKYCQRNGYSQNYCVLLDYSIPSGSPRLFVWSFAKGKVIYKGYAMHGPGRGSTAKKPVFSNDFGSHCSCLGRFEITRQHGLRNKSGYYLKGLDSSNSNARDRGIMIHPSTHVDRNIWREYIPLHSKSCLGCVTVSCKDMAYVSNIMRDEEKNLLLWAYYNK